MSTTASRLYTLALVCVCVTHGHAVFVFSFPRVSWPIFVPTLRMNDIQATRVVDHLFTCFQEVSQTPSTDFWYNGTFRFDDEDDDPGTYIDVWFPNHSTLETILVRMLEEQEILWVCMCMHVESHHMNCSHAQYVKRTE